MDNLIVMNVRVPEALREKVAYLGRQENRTLSQQVRHIMQQFVENRAKKLKPKAEENNGASNG